METLPWATIKTAVQSAEAKADFPEYYEVKSATYAGKDRALIPCGIPYRCAHTGDAMGVVSGTIPQDQVERMLKLALETSERTPAAWQRAVATFDRETAQTYDNARKMQKPGLLNFLADPRNQYDPHAQIVVRLRDQDGAPIPVAQSDIFFVSNQQEKGSIPIQSLIQDTAVSGLSPNSILFYLRVKKFVRKEQDWIDQLTDVLDFAFEITAIEPAAPRDHPLVSYLPLRLPLNRRQMRALIQPHRTTIIDVTLLRLPAPEIYQLVKS
jgi:hypothetical protein